MIRRDRSGVRRKGKWESGQHLLMLREMCPFKANLSFVSSHQLKECRDLEWGLQFSLCFEVLISAQILRTEVATNTKNEA